MPRLRGIARGSAAAVSSTHTPLLETTTAPVPRRALQRPLQRRCALMSDSAACVHATTGVCLQGPPGRRAHPCHANLGAATQHHMRQDAGGLPAAYGSADWIGNPRQNTSKQHVPQTTKATRALAEQGTTAFRPYRVSRWSCSIDDCHYPHLKIGCRPARRSMNPCSASHTSKLEARRVLRG